MNAGQQQFFNFILERTQPEKIDEMKRLLEEGFQKQEEGSFTPEYLADYIPKMLSFLLPQYVEEVKTITEQFSRKY